MMFHHFKILLRQQSRQKLHTIITVVCLTTGLTIHLRSFAVQYNPRIDANRLLSL
jgi:hypothetical protein